MLLALAVSQLLTYCTFVDCKLYYKFVCISGNVKITGTKPSMIRSDAEVVPMTESVQHLASNSA
jgi:hypothetical protein